MMISDGMVVKKRGKFLYDSGASGHPLIVILHDDHVIWGALCTDARNASKFPHTISFNRQYCGLSKNTVVICDKLRQFNISDITKYYGDVSTEDMSRIIAALDNGRASADVAESLYSNLRRTAI